MHLILGLVALAAGFGVLSGRTWARVVAIILAVVSALVNFSVLGEYPIWMTILITLDVIVIYALAAHGRELQP